MTEMEVTKRSGKREEVSFDKILKRVKKLGKEADINLNFSQLCLKVIDQLYNGIPTSKIDELTAEQCASQISNHYDYGQLAARISLSNLQKNTSNSFFETMKQTYEAGLLSQSTWTAIKSHRKRIEGAIQHDRDYLLDYFGFKTLERAYLTKIRGKIVERPQYMWMRVSVGIHSNDIEEAIKTYDGMSKLEFTHATPTLFNAGTPHPQLSSCFLETMKDDSIEGIFDTLRNSALISKWAGGIGLDISKIRCTGSHIQGTNGTSNGIVPMLRVFNSTARYVDQGGGKRQGSFAIYLEPHHGDIEDFLELRKNHGDEELKARDLFYGLWISDYFMKCIQENADWYLFCPNQAPGLCDVWGDEYEALFKKYVVEEKYIKKMPARELWYKILDSQMETGTPYMLFKDHANRKSNQQNLGTIRCSNLCTEIIEYTSPDEIAVCNLASVSLPKCVDEDGAYNYKKLHATIKQMTRNLNRVIDVNFYPTPETRRSNMLHRPIGVGVQGLADTFFLMDVPFHSEEAKTINKLIFETIYHAALETSVEMAIERRQNMKILRQALDNDKLGFFDYDNPICDVNQSPQEKPVQKVYQQIWDDTRPLYAETKNLSENHLGSYATFEGSPASQGHLQFDLWNVEPSTRYDWEKLRAQVVEHGMRNSLLVAPMPTASTSQILGNNEAFEPITSNLYARRTNAGEFLVVNKHLVKELSEQGIWNTEVKNSIIANRGSVQHLEQLTDHQKQKYKIVWEMPMRHLIDMSADRGAFICQSQSLNLWIEDPNYNVLTAMHFHSWRSGLKTGIYYLRRKPKHQAQQFTIEPELRKSSPESNANNEPCEMCSA